MSPLSALRVEPDTSSSTSIPPDLFIAESMPQYASISEIDLPLEWPTISTAPAANDFPQACRTYYARLLSARSWLYRPLLFRQIPDLDPVQLRWHSALRAPCPAVPNLQLHFCWTSAELPETPPSTASTGTSHMWASLRPLSRLEQLENGWDPYGGPPPTQAALAVARQIIVTVHEQFWDMANDAVTPFAVVPISGGGVQLEWRTPEADIEVDIGPDGELGYLYIDRRAKPPQYSEGEGVPISHLVELVGSVLRPPSTSRNRQRRR